MVDLHRGLRKNEPKLRSSFFLTRFTASCFSSYRSFEICEARNKKRKRYLEDITNFLMDSNDRSTIYAIIAIFAIFSLLCLCIRCWRAGIVEADTSIDQLMEDALRENAIIVPPGDDLDSQGVEDRRLVILTSVIHKVSVK